MDSESKDWEKICFSQIEKHRELVKRGTIGDIEFINNIIETFMGASRECDTNTLGRIFMKVPPDILASIREWVDAWPCTEEGWAACRSIRGVGYFAPMTPEENERMLSTWQVDQFRVGQAFRSVFGVPERKDDTRSPVPIGLFRGSYRIGPEYELVLQPQTGEDECTHPKSIVSHLAWMKEFRSSSEFEICAKVLCELERDFSSADEILKALTPPIIETLGNFFDSLPRTTEEWAAFRVCSPLDALPEELLDSILKFEKSQQFTCESGFYPASSLVVTSYLWNLLGNDYLLEEKQRLIYRSTLLFRKLFRS